jgi:hypothetical protein
MKGKTEWLFNGREKERGREGLNEIIIKYFDFKA